jgi:hypothetical protein
VLPRSGLVQVPNTESENPWLGRILPVRIADYARPWEPNQGAADGRRVAEKSRFLARQRHFEWIACLPKQYIETESHGAMSEHVFASRILPRWFSNQWLADSPFAHANFYFL